jgi:hypothetical protein
MRAVERRRPLMNDWAAFLEGAPHAHNVVPITRAG